MTAKRWADVRPGDLIARADGQVTRVSKVTWTHKGLFWETTGGVQSTQVPNPDTWIEVAAPMPRASLSWSATDQAWVVSIDTDGIPDDQARVMVNLDGGWVYEPPDPEEGPVSSEPYASEDRG